MSPPRQIASNDCIQTAGRLSFQALLYEALEALFLCVHPNLLKIVDFKICQKKRFLFKTINQSYFDPWSQLHLTQVADSSSKASKSLYSVSGLLLLPQPVQHFTLPVPNFK